MPRPDLTDITFVLDRSGSMESIKESTVAAFNAFLRDQRAGHGQAQMSLVQFDDQYEPLYEAQPLDSVAELTAATFVPRGSTALIDAMCRTIDRTGERLAALLEDQRPGIVILVTLTDGLENASHQFTIQQLGQKIAHQRDVYRWQFLFLGANQDAIATAAQFGLARDQAMTFAANAAGTAAAVGRISPKLRKMRENALHAIDPGALLSSAPIAFDEEDRAAAMAPDPTPPAAPRKPKKP